MNKDLIKSAARSAASKVQRKLAVANLDQPRDVAPDLPAGKSQKAYADLKFALRNSGH